ncbi:MAG: biopolymer transporter ExbD [Gammaproteobacteria bacterium]|nr:biopolymer transporter ExbD [Gammaproteobacteria bacterium]
MMNKSKRAKRMERHHARRKQPALNLVSLMDIFTILVFFLLVSSSNVHQLPKKKDINLPTSTATKAPKETLIIAVTQRSILVQGREVAIISTIMQDVSPLITGLEKELKFQSSKSRVVKSPDGKIQGKAVTIMGDENIPYELLRKILATCREANYTKIAFAAMQKPASEENS